MKIIIATTFEPFVNGGDAVLADSLADTLLAAGHEIELLRLPFRPWYPEMPDQMLALRLFDLSHAGDRLITIRTPSYLLRHRHKVIWFIHHHRGAYDFWGTRYGDIPDTVEGRRYRDSIRRADLAAFAEARAVFSNSRVVAERLRSFNGVESEVLYPPLFHPELYKSREHGDSVVYVSRLVRHKRQHLAIEALALTQTAVRLVLAGPPNDAAYCGELRALIERFHLGDRVLFLPEWIADERKQELLSGALAALYLPCNEDSYGYASLEAQQARRAVITTTDSGGALELVAHGVNGLVVKPDVRSIAGAMDRLFADRGLAVRLGARGPSRIMELGISWERTLQRLLA